MAIDEASIDALGAWPWPRAVWGQLLERLHEDHDPALIALDAVFPPDNQQAFGNARFGEALSLAPAVVGQLMLPEAGLRGTPIWVDFKPPDLLSQTNPSALQGLPRYSGTLGADPQIAIHARIGHINAHVDPDGVMRTVPTLLCSTDATRCSASFLQAMVAQLLNVDTWTLRRGTWREAPWLLQPGDFAPLALPVDEAMSLLIPWRHPSGLRYLSVSEIWNRTVEPGALDHQILLFGGVSLGLGDLATSVLYQTVPGMEVHAQTLRGWLNGALPYTPRYGAPLMVLYTLILAALLLLNVRHVRRLAFITVAGTLLPLGGTALVWSLQHSLWPAATPATFVAVAGTLLGVMQALRRRQRLIRRFEAYLPMPLRRLLDRPDAVVPRETGWGTVMVADILGYTAQSQWLSLSQLAEWGDAAIAHVIAGGQAHGAMLDNVAGDGVLMLWRTGTDREQAQAADAAVREIVCGLVEINQQLAQKGLPAVQMGVGVHCGSYLLDSFGTHQKRYTVVSEVANLAAHIERQTRLHPWPVLYSETLARLLPPDTVYAVAELPLANGRQLQLYTLKDVPANRWAGHPANVE